MMSFSATGLRHEVQGAGAELVLVHELGGSLDSFDALMPLLSSRFRLLRYDQRGAGGSPPGPRGMTLEDHANDLSGLMAEVGFRKVSGILGVAAGAAIAVTHASQGGATGSLILCAPALSVPPERRAYLQARSDLARRDGMAAVADASLARSYPETLRTDDALFARYRSRFLANDPDSYADANMALAATRATEMLPSLTMPCLVIAGRHDLLRPPSEVEQAAHAIPRAQFAVIESGHLMAVQAPAALSAQVLAFLASAPPTDREDIDA